MSFLSFFLFIKITVSLSIYLSILFINPIYLSIYLAGGRAAAAGGHGRGAAGAGAGAAGGGV